MYIFQSWSDQEVAEGHQRSISQNQLTTQTINRNINNVKKQFVPVRPVQAAPIHRSNDSHEQPYVYNKTIVVSVFKYLSKKDLATCASVCRNWARYSVDPNLWRTIDLSNNILTAAHLSGIISRQPETLILNWTNVAKRQLAWLLSRLSQLRNLSLKGCNWSGVCALNTYACPPLASLDLSLVSGKI